MGARLGGEILSLASWTWILFLGQICSASPIAGPGADDITDRMTPRVGETQSRPWNIRWLFAALSGSWLPAERTRFVCCLSRRTADPKQFSVPFWKTPCLLLDAIWQLCGRKCLGLADPISYHLQLAVGCCWWLCTPTVRRLIPPNKDLGRAGPEPTGHVGVQHPRCTTVH
jgi:hypothetical protein